MATITSWTKGERATGDQGFTIAADFRSAVKEVAIISGIATSLTVLSIIVGAFLILTRTVPFS